MKLVYSATQKPVIAGDSIMFEGKRAKVVYFAPPRSLASSGKVTIEVGKQQREYYVSIIGAEWIEREDRAASDALERAMYGRRS